MTRQILMIGVKNKGPITQAFQSLCPGHEIIHIELDSTEEISNSNISCIVFFEEIINDSDDHSDNYRFDTKNEKNLFQFIKQHNLHPQVPIIRIGNRQHSHYNYPRLNMLEKDIFYHNDDSSEKIQGLILKAKFRTKDKIDPEVKFELQESQKGYYGSWTMALFLSSAIGVPVGLLAALVLNIVKPHLLSPILQIILTSSYSFILLPIILTITLTLISILIIEIKRFWDMGPYRAENVKIQQKNQIWQELESELKPNTSMIEEDRKILSPAC